MVAMAQSALSGERLREVDGFLTEAWADQARHDERLRGLTVEVRFDRGWPTSTARSPNRRSCGWSGTWWAGSTGCWASGAG